MSYEVNDDIYPASAVIYILSRWGNTYASGTGFLVGKNDVLTAAHVIYDGAQGGVADEIGFIPPMIQMIGIMLIFRLFGLSTTLTLIRTRTALFRLAISTDPPT